MKKLLLMLAVLVLPFTALEAVKIQWGVGSGGFHVGVGKGKHYGHGPYGYYGNRWGYPYQRFGYGYGSYGRWGYPYYRYGRSYPGQRWYCDASGYCYYRRSYGGWNW